MAGAQTVYQALLVFSLLVTTGTAVYVWSNRDQRGALALSAVFGSAALWSGAALVQTLWPSGRTTLLTSKTILFCVVVQMVGFLLFALAYTGRESYVTRRTVALLSVEPLVFTALVWTNGAHELVWTATVESAASGGVEMAAKPLFWVHTVYSYGLIALGVGLILLFALRSKYLYQRQAAALVVATVAPWLANVASLTVVDSYHLTPIAFALTAVVLTWAVVSEDFLDISPVATELVMDTIDIAVFVVDDEDRIVERNDAAGQFFDGEREQIVGSSVRDLFDDGAAILPIYEELSRQTEPTTREATLEDRHVRIQMSPLREHDDRLVGRTYMVVDLTEQREREEELRRRNEQLDRFAGVVSHDLRNPLEVADGGLRLARETGAEEHFERVARAHERMDRLIEDILVLARQDETALDVGPISIADAAEEAWEYVQTGDSSLEIRDDVTLQADADRFGQLLENCFRNAVEHGSTSPPSQAPVDAAEHGNESVTVFVGTLPEEAGFYVGDDGPGFGDVDGERLFEAGYTTNSDGTGFGLSIVEEIAAAHGWSVSATESESGGARIEVRTDGA